MPMRAVQIQNPGRNSTLNIVEIPTPEPKDFEILVKIEATALNRADLLQRQGQYPSPEGTTSVPGLEMAGIVESVGSGVRRWKPGDFVFSLLPGGGYAEFCVVHEDMAMPIPESISFREAAAIPETFLTAYQALCWVGNLNQEETVLIHAGASGVGTAAIQLAGQLFNARILTTAGKKKKLDACRKLGADYAYNYRKEDFAEKISGDLGNNEVDLVIDFAGASHWDQNIEVLAIDGRMVILAVLGGYKVRQMNILPLLRKRLSVSGSTLRSRSPEYKIRLTREFSTRTLELFEQELLKPVIDSVYDWNDVEKAHKRMAENKNIGKIVLTGM